MATATNFEVMPPEHKPDALVQTPQESNGALVLMPVMNLAVATQRLKEFQEFVKGYMVEGEDYGKIPGVSKPSLFKPGAEKLCELYGLADTYPEEKTRRIENWETGLFFYEFTCVLTKKGTSVVIGEGKGSCNSYESRYRFRDATRKCPQCGKDTIIKGKQEYGGGWLCWGKKGGCGKKFADGDQSIEGQDIGKVQNENLTDVMNTVLKMAKKRAKIDAVIGATRSSGIFTQDVEDQGAAAASPEESAAPKTVPVEGKVTELKADDKGALWLRVSHIDIQTREVTEYACKVERKELADQLKNSQGALVELLTDRRVNGKNKHQFYLVKGILGISNLPDDAQPLEITDDDIPF